jgi:hypothetical protein
MRDFGGNEVARRARRMPDDLREQARKDGVQQAGVLPAESEGSSVVLRSSAGKTEDVHILARRRHVGADYVAAVRCESELVGAEAVAARWRMM